MPKWLLKGSKMDSKSGQNPSKNALKNHTEKKMPLAGPWDAKEDPRPEKGRKSAAGAAHSGTMGFSTVQPANTVNNGVKPTFAIGECRGAH